MSVGRASDAPMSAAHLIETFLEMMAAERAAARNTLTAYGKDLADADAFLGRKGADLARADAATVEAYFVDLGERGLSAATAARRRSAVRQFYRFALEEGWRSDDPSRRVDAPRRSRPLPKLLSRDEVERLIASAALESPEVRRLMTVPGVNVIVAESQSVYHFAKARLYRKEDSDVALSELTPAYADYAKARDWTPLPEHKFQAKLRDLMLELFGASKSNSIKRNNKSVRGYHNIALAMESERDDEDPF